MPVSHRIDNGIPSNSPQLHSMKKDTETLCKLKGVPSILCSVNLSLRDRNLQMCKN